MVREASSYTISSKRCRIWSRTSNIRVRRAFRVCSLRDAMAYICRNYPHKDELSNARVTKMVYLADWRSAITRGKQLTDTEWKFDHYGPFVYDILDIARDGPAFKVISTQNPYGAPKD